VDDGGRSWHDGRRSDEASQNHPHNYHYDCDPVIDIYRQSAFKDTGLKGSEDKKGGSGELAEEVW
jgi:hypothetical protein